MISKVERGEAQPITPVLGKLAEPPDLPISQFVAGPQGIGTLVVPTIERRSLSPLYRGWGIDLAGTLDTVRPHVGTNTSVLPFLNGVAHLDTIAAALPAARLLGGMDHIGATTVAPDRIIQLNHLWTLLAGSRPGAAAKGASAANVARYAASLRLTGAEGWLRACKLDRPLTARSERVSLSRWSVW